MACYAAEPATVTNYDGAFRAAEIQVRLQATWRRIRALHRMIDSERYERNTAETAYCFRVLGYYGTVSKAVTALRNRKGMEDLDRQSATHALNKELALLDRTQVLIQDVLKRAKKSYHPQLTNEQFESGTEFIRKELTRDFPERTQSIDYMIAMLWHMPRVR